MILTSLLTHQNVHSLLLVISMTGVYQTYPWRGQGKGTSSERNGPPGSPSRPYSDSPRWAVYGCPTCNGDLSHLSTRLSPRAFWCGLSWTLPCSLITYHFPTYLSWDTLGVTLRWPMHRYNMDIKAARSRGSTLFSLRISATYFSAYLTRRGLYSKVLQFDGDAHRDSARTRRTMA